MICDQMRYLTKKIKTNVAVVNLIHGTYRIGGKQLTILNPDRKMSTNYS